MPHAPTKSVNEAFTTSPLASRVKVWQSAGMSTRSPQAGGFLLIMAIFAGLIGGIMAGQLVMGTLAGTAVGILLAVAIWLLDRRRA